MTKTFTILSCITLMTGFAAHADKFQLGTIYKHGTESDPGSQKAGYNTGNYYTSADIDCAEAKRVIEMYSMSDIGLFLVGKCVKQQRDSSKYNRTVPDLEVYFQTPKLSINQVTHPNQKAHYFEKSKMINFTRIDVHWKNAGLFIKSLNDPSGTFQFIVDEYDQQRWKLTIRRIKY